MSVLVCLLVLGVAGVRIMAEEQMEPQTEFLEHSRSFKVGNVWLLGGIVSIEIFWVFRIQFFSIFCI